MKFRLSSWDQSLGVVGGRALVGRNIREVIFTSVNRSLLDVGRGEGKHRFSMCRSLQEKNYRQLQKC